MPSLVLLPGDRGRILMIVELWGFIASKNILNASKMRKKFAQQACIVAPEDMCKQVSMLRLLLVIDLLCTLPLISIVARRALDFLT